MKLFRHLLVLALALPLALLAPRSAHAQAGPPPDASTGNARAGMMRRGYRHGPHGGPAMRAEVERRIRTMRAVALANRLQLDEATALRLNAVMNGYDQKRDAIRARMHHAMMVLQAQSEAPKADPKQVDDAIAAVISAQQQMAELRREELHDLMKDLDAKRRAQLVIFFREFPNEIRRMMHRGRMMEGGGPSQDVEE